MTQIRQPDEWENVNPKDDIKTLPSMRPFKLDTPRHSVLREKKGTYTLDSILVVGRRMKRGQFDNTNPKPTKAVKMSETKQKLSKAEKLKAKAEKLQKKAQKPSKAELLKLKAEKLKKKAETAHENAEEQAKKKRLKKHEKFTWTFWKEDLAVGCFVIIVVLINWFTPSLRPKTKEELEKEEKEKLVRGDD